MKSEHAIDPAVLLRMDVSAVRRRTYAFGAVLFVLLFGGSLVALNASGRLNAALGLSAAIVSQFAAMVFVGVRLRHLAVIRAFQEREKRQVASESGR